MIIIGKTYVDFQFQVPNSGKSDPAWCTENIRRNINNLQENQINIKSNLGAK